MEVLMEEKAYLKHLENLWKYRKKATSIASQRFWSQLIYKLKLEQEEGLI